MRIGPKIGPGISPRINASIGMSRSGVSFVAAVGATFSVPVDFVLVTITTPAGILPGDTMLIFVTTQDGGLAVAPPTGFTLVASLSTASAVCGIYRRIATGSELTSYSSHLTAGASHATGAMLVYRGLDGVADIVGSGAVDVMGNTAWPCPSITLANTSDLFIGMASTIGDFTSFTPPVHGTERLDELQITEEAQQIALFDIQPGVAGATGALTVTCADAISGVAVSIALKAA